MYCPHCGIENAVDARKCVSCGSDLQAPSERDPYADKPHPPVYAPHPAPLQYQQPYQPPAQGQGGRIPNYLAQSITIAVLGTCCWIVPTVLAIPAIVFGSQVNSKLAVGDAAGAAESSRNAKIWCWVSFGSVVLIAFVWLTLLMAVAVA